jgi:pyridoxal biosynthesis lyase PdxS
MGCVVCNIHNVTCTRHDEAALTVNVLALPVVPAEVLARADAARAAAPEGYARLAADLIACA